MSIGLENIATEKFPVHITVKPKKTTNVEFNIIKSATVNGQIILAENKPDSNAGNDFSKAVILDANSGKHTHMTEGILVELSRGDEVLRTITDYTGTFSFTNIRPGSWNLKVYDYSLPSRYYMETKEINLSLVNGENKELLIKILENKKRILILDEGTIISQLH